jgi:hypothetical protein
MRPRNLTNPVAGIAVGSVAHLEYFDRLAAAANQQMDRILGNRAAASWNGGRAPDSAKRSLAAWRAWPGQIPQPPRHPLKYRRGHQAAPLKLFKGRFVAAHVTFFRYDPVLRKKLFRPIAEHSAGLAEQNHLLSHDGFLFENWESANPAGNSCLS